VAYIIAVYIVEGCHSIAIRSSHTVRMSDGNTPTPVVVQSSSRSPGLSGVHSFGTSSTQVSCDGSRVQ